eukprot:SAG31_NODE_19822_length_590_cov_6.747454_2_plen_60_part_01
MRACPAAQLESKVTGDEAESYFVAGKSMGFLVLMLTLFSTNFSGFTIVALPEEAAYIGLG